MNPLVLRQPMILTFFLRKSANTVLTRCLSNLKSILFKNAEIGFMAALQNPLKQHTFLGTASRIRNVLCESSRCDVTKF